ncbi:MAG: LPXTG cell wall anchor domain-containing protein [Acidobacteriota bacterium]|jgi:LPXTG-motif cell wall-anchored protein|nr:LPXTG cell wall anchor domain-containing protein [Acidobacteriota bacterium]
MSVKRSVVVLIAVVLLLGTGIAAAQHTTVEIKRGTVVHVYGNNLVVKMADGTIKEFDVPEGFTFNIDGKQVPVGDLKPGTMLTSAVKTTETPREVEVTEFRSGTVLKVAGTTLMVRMADGEVRRLTDVPRDQRFEVDGKQLRVEELREGMKLRATIVSTHSVVVTDEERMVAGTAPQAPRPAAKAKPAPRAAAAPAPMLPKTGTSTPLVGLFGMILLLIGAGIAVIRRF